MWGRKKIGGRVVSVVVAICCFLCGCADKTPQITRESLAQKVESYAETYIVEYNKDEPIVIDGQEFDFGGAFAYGSQFFEKDWDKYVECMDIIKGSLLKDSARLAEIYSNYVEALNAFCEYDNIDAYEYKTEVSGALFTSDVANDITKLIKDLNTDAELLKKTNGMTPLSLLNFNFYGEFKIENADEKTKYFNDFSEELVTLPYLTKKQSEKMSTFLANYDIEVGRVEIEGAQGVTYYNDDSVAQRLVVGGNYELFDQMNILAHEMGHVSDAPSDLVSDESVANTTALLSSFYASEFDYGSLSEPITPLVYEQSMYAFIMSHVFGFGAENSFSNNIYSRKGKLTESDILDSYDKELNSVASGYDEAYEIFWRIAWKHAAYNDIVNRGHEYIYAALNAVYIWDMYKAEETRETALGKYHLLLENDTGFDKLDDIGLIGDSNISDAYNPLKNFVITNYETINEIYTLLPPATNN